MDVATGAATEAAGGEAAANAVASGATAFPPFGPSSPPAATSPGYDGRIVLGLCGAGDDGQGGGECDEGGADARRGNDGGGGRDSGPGLLWRVPRWGPRRVFSCDTDRETQKCKN